MSLTTYLASGAAATIVGTLALLHPLETIELTRRGSDWAKGLILGQQTVAPQPERSFDEIVDEILALDDMPRPEMERAVLPPHHQLGVRPNAKATSGWARRLASARHRTAAPRRSVHISRPDGIFARSRLGANRLNGRHRSGARSLFEQSRSYRRNGSAFDRIRKHPWHRR